jgi:DNA-binding response OmpR family regulator
VKIIMVTALDDMKNVFVSFKSLCDAYVFKPVDTAQLVEKLRALNLVPAGGVNDAAVAPRIV